MDAIVLGSYADLYGGNDTEQYSLYLEGIGECAWFYGDQLTLVEIDRLDLLEKWRNKEEKDKKIHSDLDWIFKNGKELIEKPIGASITILAKCIGIENL